MWVDMAQFIDLYINPTGVEFQEGYAHWEAVTIGGQTPDGEDATNELTYLFLESKREFPLNYPDLAARIHSRSPERFLREVAQTIKDGSGFPKLINDEEVVFLNSVKGCPVNEALDYAGKPAARRLEDGELMCCATWLDAPDSVTFDRIRGGKTLAYIGYPTADGSCGSVMRLYGDVGAFAATASPAGCWEFIQYAVQNGADAAYYGSPVYAPLMLEQVAQKNENSGQYTTATEEDVQAYINAAQACRVMGYRDESVMDILRDECAPMLTGEVTPEQAAKNIQARVSLYMAEQYG